MSKLTLLYEPSRWLHVELRSRFTPSIRSTMKAKRTLLFLAVLAISIVLTGCTDHLDLTGLPTSCKDQTGKDVAVRVEMRIMQAGELRAVDTITVNSKGEADLMIGAETQSKSLLKAGHRPATLEPNVIYTGDPISIELKLKDPCKADTKTRAIVLDDLPHHKTKGRVTYTLQYDQFKS
jgi:hypothetical protein